MEVFQISAALDNDETSEKTKPEMKRGETE